MGAAPLVTLVTRGPRRCRPRVALDVHLPLRAVADHQQRITELIGTLAPAAIPLADAHGLVLSDPVVATEALPSFDNSAMDGYAVRAADIVTATVADPVRLPVAADIPAGAPVGDLQPGTAHRIMTGAPLPRGADAVVEVEATDAGTDVVAIAAVREAGSFIRSAGGDVAPGATVLRRAR